MIADDMFFILLYTLGWWKEVDMEEKAGGVVMKGGMCDGGLCQ